jgi:hypothetical protein
VLSLHIFYILGDNGLQTILLLYDLQRLVRFRRRLKLDEEEEGEEEGEQEVEGEREREEGGFENHSRRDLFRLTLSSLVSYVYAKLQYLFRWYALVVIDKVELFKYIP